MMREAESGGDESSRTKLRDLEITNGVKVQVIVMMEKERDRLLVERENHVHELMATVLDNWKRSCIKLTCLGIRGSAGRKGR
jgi:hypothetical protein